MFTQQNRDELESKGLTVVPGVISLEDCDRHQAYFREWLATFPSNTWPQCIGSLIQRYKSGHMPPAWECRLAVKPVFAEIWKTDKLLSSMDGIAIGRPPEEGKETFMEEKDYWLRTDQSADRVGLHAYQGAVYLEECAEDDWTLEVMEESHKYFAEYMDRNNVWRCTSLKQRGIDWFKNKGCLRKRVPCPKGGMILWDSRLFHTDVRPIQGRKNPGRWRFVVFVCMTPACWAVPSDLAIKKKAFENMRLTTHWPSQEVSMFSSDILKNQPKDNDVLDSLPDVATTDEAKRLAGILPYAEGGEEEVDYHPEWDKERWGAFIDDFKTKKLVINRNSTGKKTLP